MNATPSVPPRGVRASLPITVMRLKPLPARDPDEVGRWKALSRRRPVPRRERRAV
jgi:hypothetical protein